MNRRTPGLLVAGALAIAARTAFAQVSGLPAEITAREAADAQLQTKIDAEAAARATVDALLQRNIDGEAGARAATDAQLQTQIDQLRARGGAGGSATVDCTSGGSVAEALASGATQITVRGTCNESVDVTRDDVMLQGEPGATVRGPDASVNTITVRANRVTIDGLTVTGGRNGITGLGAANLTVRNCTVQSTGRTGISYASGSSGLVDGCFVQSNGRDGVAVDGAQATIINSTVTGNTRSGVLVVNGGTARIGVTDRQAGAGNIITQNGASGITVSLSSAALIAMNTITENGTNPSLGRQGIFVGQATASIVGGNTISNNPGQGVFAGNGAVVLLGDPSLGLPTVNTISANGNGANPGGVIAFLGSTMVVRDAVIEQNNGPGLTFSMHSHGQVINATIRNNVDVLNTAGFINGGDGIRLLLGSVLLPATPTTTISGNAGLGFTCLDGESSAVNTGMPFLSITGNARGDFPNCSAF